MQAVFSSVTPPPLTQLDKEVHFLFASKNSVKDQVSSWGFCNHFVLMLSGALCGQENVISCKSCDFQGLEEQLGLGYSGTLILQKNKFTCPLLFLLQTAACK